MSGYEVKKCRSCNALIIWSVTRRGRRMPVDAEPRPNGNVTLRHQDGDANLPPVAEHDDDGRLALFADRSRYVSHFATCETASQWRHR